jgi:hypothetical protein
MLTLRQRSLTKKATNTDQSLVRMGFYRTVYKELFQGSQYSSDLFPSPSVGISLSALSVLLF